MKPSVAPFLRPLHAFVWLLYVVLIPIHLAYSHHCSFSEEMSAPYNHSGDSQENSEDHGHKPHYASEHDLRLTVQKSLSVASVDILVTSATSITSYIDPTCHVGLLISSAIRPVCGAPPTLQDGQAPPSI